MRIAVHIGDHSRFRQLIAVGEQRGIAESSLPQIPQHVGARDHHHVGKTVPVEIVEEDGMQSVQLSLVSQRKTKDLLEGWRTRSGQHPQTGGVDLRGNRIVALVAPRGPLDRELTFDDEAPLRTVVDDVKHHRDRRARWRTRARRKEAGVMPLGLNQAVTLTRQPGQKLLPAGAREHPARGVERKAPNTVVEFLDASRRPRPSRRAARAALSIPRVKWVCLLRRGRPRRRGNPLRRPAAVSDTAAGLRDALRRVRGPPPPPSQQPASAFPASAPPAPARCALRSRRDTARRFATLQCARRPQLRFRVDSRRTAGSETAGRFNRHAGGRRPAT
jgi:hypothetical protein